MTTTAVNRIDDATEGGAAREHTAPTMPLWEKALLALGLLVGALMLLVAPEAKPIWTDESISIAWGQRSLGDILMGRATSPDALPLHPLLIHTTKALFGHSLAAYRLASALPAAIGLWFVWKLGARNGRHVGLLALWLAALSPGLILFDRMSRYHGLTALLVTASVYMALRALETGRRRDTLLYAVTTFLMLMSYVLSVFVVAAQFAVLVLRWKREPHAAKVFLGLVGACAVFAPFLLRNVMAAQTGGMTQTFVEDPTVGLGLRGFLFRFALPAYVFSVGETVYPWNWAVSVPGLLASAAAFVAGFWALRKRPDLMVPLGALFVVLLAAAATSGKFGASQTVGSMAKRVSFALPLFCVTLATGALSFRAAPVRAVLAGILLLVSAVSVRNYWAGEQFLNPNYTAPWGEVVRTIREKRLDPDTLVVSRGELALEFYLKRAVPDARYADIRDEATLRESLEASDAPPRYVWIVGRDRGDRIAVGGFEEARDYLAKNFARVAAEGALPRTETETRWLERVFKRPASRHYIEMELYDTATPARREEETLLAP